MTDQSHNACNLTSRRHAPRLALSRDTLRHAVFVGFEDCSLMEADCCSVNAHVKENDIRIWKARGQSQIVGNLEIDTKKNTIDCTMPLPERSIEVVLAIIESRPMKVNKVSPEYRRHDAGACPWRVPSLLRLESFLQRKGQYWLAVLKGNFLGRKVSQDLSP